MNVCGTVAPPAGAMILIPRDSSVAVAAGVTVGYGMVCGGIGVRVGGGGGGGCVAGAGRVVAVAAGGAGVFAG